MKLKLIKNFGEKEPKQDYSHYDYKNFHIIMLKGQSVGQRSKN